MSSFCVKTFQNPLSDPPSGPTFAENLQPYPGEARPDIHLLPYQAKTIRIPAYLQIVHDVCRDDSSLHIAYDTLGYASLACKQCTAKPLMILQGVGIHMQGNDVLLSRRPGKPGPTATSPTRTATIDRVAQIDRQTCHRHTIVCSIFIAHHLQRHLMHTATRKTI